jgi:hypothetical protein
MLQDILVGAQLNEEDMVRLHLPCDMGGCGITLPSYVALSAHVGSLYQSVSQQQQILRHDSIAPLEAHYAPRLAEIKEIVDPVNTLPQAEIVSSESLRKVKQPQLWLTQLSNCSLLQKTYPKNSTPAAKFNHIEACKEAKADFLSAIPTTLKERFTNLELRVSLLQRLNRPVYTKSVQCPRCQSAILDRSGHHALFCKSGLVNHITRHNYVRDTLYEIAQEAGFTVSKEKALGRLRTPLADILDNAMLRGNDRPADVMIDNYLNGEAVLIDVTVCDSLKHISVAKFDPSATFHQAANRKKDDYKNRVRALGHHFLPFVVGSLGGFCPDARHVLSFLAEKWGLTFNKPVNYAMTLLFRRVSLALFKIQASQLIDRGHVAGILC